MAARPPGLNSRGCGTDGEPVLHSQFCVGGVPVSRRPHPVSSDPGTKRGTSAAKPGGPQRWQETGSRRGQRTGGHGFCSCRSRAAARPANRLWRCEEHLYPGADDALTGRRWAPVAARITRRFPAPRGRRSRIAGTAGPPPIRPLRQEFSGASPDQACATTSRTSTPSSSTASMPWIIART
jgi:hypothetical protein